MSPAYYYRTRRRFHARYKLRYRESRLNITADCIENYEQSLDTSVLFDRYKSRNNVLVFCSLVLLRKNVVPLNLTYNGKAMYEMLGVLRNTLPEFSDKLLVLTGLIGRIFVFLFIFHA